jgi:hypothetical protein
MRRNDWLIITGAFIYSGLFYQQLPGINFLLFTVILNALALAQDRLLLKSYSWLSASIGSLIAAAAVFYYGTGLPLFANITSLILLAGLSFKPQSSLFIAFIQSAFSLLASLPMLIIGLFERKQSSSPTTGKQPLGKILLLVAIPLFIAFVFLTIYRAANPLFDQFIQKLDFSGLTLGWLYCLFTGMLIMYAFFKQRQIKSLAEADSNATNKLPAITLEQHSETVWAGILSIKSEAFTGIVLFALLNVLLLVVNFLDVYYLGILKELPKGITLSQYLHNGTNALIFSLVLAIGIILFYFRGYLNFYEKNRWVKALSYTWILQNLVLVGSIFYRNSIYIGEYGLTHKRIGVYFYIAICTGGLLTTIIKIVGIRSNWFLFRKNTWILYTVMIMACVVDWDYIITDFNIRNFEKDHTMEIDEHYLADLSHTNLALLYQYYVVERKVLKSQHLPYNQRGSFDSASFDSGSEYVAPTTSQMYNEILEKYKRLDLEVKEASWPSYCISKQKNLQAVGDILKANQP